MIKRYAIAEVPSRGYYLSMFNDSFVYFFVASRFMFKWTAGLGLWLWTRRMAGMFLDSRYLEEGRYQIVDLLKENKVYPTIDW